MTQDDNKEISEQISALVDELGHCGALSTDGENSVCMYPAKHEGVHGWEISPELSALANEIQVETGVPEQVAVAAARYAFNQIQEWKGLTEKAWLTTEITRSYAVETTEVLQEILSNFEITAMDQQFGYNVTGFTLAESLVKARGLLAGADPDSPEEPEESR